MQVCANSAATTVPYICTPCDSCNFIAGMLLLGFLSSWAHTVDSWCKCISTQSHTIQHLACITLLHPFKTSHSLCKRAHMAFELMACAGMRGRCSLSGCAWCPTASCGWSSSRQSARMRRGDMRMPWTASSRSAAHVLRPKTYTGVYNMSCSGQMPKRVAAKAVDGIEASPGGLCCMRCVRFAPNV